MTVAHYLVARQTGEWFIRFEGERYGPFPTGPGALIAAVQAANQAGKDGHDAQVRLRASDGGVATVWAFGTDAYPSPWVEELHRTALLPRRERATPSTLPRTAGAHPARTRTIVAAGLA